MPDIASFSVYSHQLDPAQEALVKRTIDHCNGAQGSIRFALIGDREVPVTKGKVRWKLLAAMPKPERPEMIVTGLSLKDNWFSHTSGNRTLITAADWGDAFAEWRGSPPVAGPDAYLIESFASAALLAATSLDEREVSHKKTTGCLADLCWNKSDQAIKLRSGFLCNACRNLASEAGVSGVYLDAIQGLLDRMRQLVLGRSPQSSPPASRTRDDDHVEPMPEGQRFAIPPGLRDALHAKQLTVLIGSGFSVQADVKVTYDVHGWGSLPKWSEVGGRLSKTLHAYMGKHQEPRDSQTLRSFLTDLDFFREELGDQYYPRAIFDLFLPRIQSTGLANRLVFRLPVRWILTTNYDALLNFACPAGTPIYTWREARQAGEYIRRAQGLPPILKLHGCAFRTDTVVLTAQEYEKLSRHEDYLALTHRIFGDHTILFLGYGLNDPLDLDMAITAANLGGAAQGEKYALVHHDRADALRSKFSNVQLITYEAHEDVPRILAALAKVGGS